MRAAAIGCLVALGAAFVALLVLRFPPLLGGPVRYGPLEGMAIEPLLLRAFVFMPLDTVIPEEFGFRGVLLARLRRTGGTSRAVLLSAAAFTLWHVAIVAATVGQTNFREASALTLLAVVGALAAVFAGGAFFALLRIRTGHLAAAAAAHWTFNAALLLGLWPLA